MDHRPAKPQDLSKEWSGGRFRKVYYLMGQLDEVKDAVAELKSRFQADCFNLSEFTREEDSGAAAVSDALTQPVFAERRLVIVSNPRIAARDPEPFIEYLKDPLATTTLVMVSDQRKPGAKDPLASLASSQGAVCVYYPLRDFEARARLAEETRKWGKSLAADAAELLVEEAGLDWHILRQEVEKAALFVGEARAISRDDVLACLGYRKGADPYILTRLVGRRELGPCLSHLRAIFSAGKAEDHAFPVLAQTRNVVAKQLRAMRLLREGAAPDSVLAALRIKDWGTYEGFLGWLRPLSERRLARDLAACARVEADLKSKTWLDPHQEVERLVVELCREQATSRTSAVAPRPSIPSPGAGPT
ncbi:MAG: hypothetical protein HY748_17130 [Elusimicrobia bacterium]|nr:hypothetical protein [Elusimicrobiota bacterium]